MFKPFISFGVILLSLAFGFFYVKPAYDRVQEKRANIQTLTDTFKSTDRIRDLIEETGKSLQSVDPTDLARFDVFLPETIDTLRLANDLQGLGAKQNLVLTDIKVTEKAKEQKLDTSKTAGGALGALNRTFSVGQAGSVGQQGGAEGATTGAGSTDKDKFVATKASFTVVSTYEGFRLFLQSLERSLGVMNVTSLTFKEFTGGEGTKSQKGMPTLYQFTVEIETYSLE